MDALERELTRAGDTIGRNEPRIRRLLQQLDLDTSALNTLRETQGWITTTRPNLRRRSETIRSQHTEWSTTPTGPTGLSDFDEAVYGKASQNPDVYSALVKLADAQKTHKLDPKTAAELEKRTGDKTFTAALLNAMGGAQFRTLMVFAMQGPRNADKTRLRDALAKTLATASPHLGEPWRKDLTTFNGFTPKQRANAQSIAQALLTGGPFDTAFLTSVATKLNDWDRKQPRGSTIGLIPQMDVPHIDPMVTVMKALSRDPEAAQDFFAKDQTALKHFLIERPMGDQGKALGVVLELATLKFRDHDGTPQAPSRGFISAKLASELVHLEGARIRTGEPPSSHLQTDTLGKILAGYISDLNWSASALDVPDKPQVISADDPTGPQVDPWGAQFAKFNLELILKEVAVEPKAFGTVILAQREYSNWLLNNGAMKYTKDKNLESLLTNANMAGAGFGLITNAAGVARIEDAKNLDETRKRNIKLIMAAINTGFAVTATAPAWMVTGQVISAWSGMAEELVGQEEENKARIEENAKVDHNRVMFRDLTASALLRHGMLGSADPPTAPHPWASLEGLKKEDEPRQNPNNFIKDDGKTLMTREEMHDKAASNSTDSSRREWAYRRWLLRGLSGPLWRSVDREMQLGFSESFPKLGPS
ncbi:hypothetical protein [Sinosporangium siamense]|uniref:Uncharacterized protein n=1 Tax=Sinosporangium siamense TaxID=1367973 RepID=A0A919V595_9ACTN|nr:hypothetical protein [Sinosporangium siamense]GII92760.1 hypothetical protein Ssi02_29910 [Sinosporangium siamense]